MSEWRPYRLECHHISGAFTDLFFDTEHNALKFANDNHRDDPAVEKSVCYFKRDEETPEIRVWVFTYRRYET